VPVRDSTAGEFEALLANVALAEAVPVDCGVKVSVKKTFCPAGSVRGNAIPLTVNSELLENADETVTLAPLALSVPVLFWLVPTTTFPKSAVAGEAASCPWLVAFPDKETTRFGSDAFDTAEMLPAAVPAEFGANVALNVMLSPEFKVSGKLSPLTLNPDPDTVT